MKRLYLTLLGSAVLMSLAAPALANADDRRSRYDRHDRIERKHGRGHDRLERKHDEVHFYGVNRRQHRRVHNQLERKHDRQNDRDDRYDY